MITSSYDEHGRRVYKIESCSKCVLVDLAYGHGSRSWSCRLARYIGDYGTPSDAVPENCPIGKGAVFEVYTEADDGEK